MTMTNLKLTNLLEQLGHHMASPYQSARAEWNIKRLRNELDLLTRRTELTKRSSVMEVAVLIGDILDKCDSAAPESTDCTRRVGAAICNMIGGGDINNIKAFLLHILDTKESKNDENNNETIPVSTAETEESSNETAFVSETISASPPDKKLVGCAVAINELSKAVWLGGEPRRSTIAVLGGVGIGKTALVARMYHDNTWIEEFEIRAWIAVPCSSYITREDILRLTLRQLRGDEAGIEAMTWEEMVNAVNQSLTGRRYLLVFDGVSDVKYWEYWDVVRGAPLPCDCNKSRVITTTRAVDVASLSSYIHRVKPLSEEASQELFCKTAFGEDRCPEDLRELSEEILEICEGLPLAITTLGDILSKNSDNPGERQRLLESFRVKENPFFEALSKIIAMVLEDLPPRLRACFVYFCLFPKESPVRIEKLIRLWISEGFLQAYQEKTMETAAERYLKDLVDKNLVKACEGFCGVNKFYRVHNLMHEIVRKNAINHGFCMYSNGESEYRQRLIISSDDDVQHALDAIEECRSIRSVFLWDTKHVNDSLLNWFFMKYSSLTVLEIDNSPLEILPKEVGHLSSLNYLSLKNTRVRKLPSTIGMLSRLEFLDISGRQSIELPMEIVKLTRLRYLLAGHGDDECGMDSTKGVKFMKGIGNLINLQTLETVEANLSGKDVIRELKKLKQLRILKVSRLTASLSKALCTCIKEMRYLKSLYLHSMRNATLDLQTVLFPSFHLEILVLKGKLRSLPILWISRLDKLRIMCLSLSSLAEDPVTCLRNLPNLESLWLYGAYRGPRLTFKTGFKKLKLLVLREMHELEVVEIAEDTMPFLEELRIGPSPLLKEVPIGVASLKCLKVLSFYDMPYKFVLSLQPNDGSDFLKVQHVPSVLFHYKFGSIKRYISYYLGEPDLLFRLKDGGFEANIDDVCWRDSRRSFSYSDDEGETASAASNILWDNIRHSSFNSGQFSFFSDDIED